jgi:uncharacterized protein (TIGR02246 family)
MKRTMCILLAGGLVAVLAATQMTADDGPAAKPADMEIRALAAEFTSAFNKGEAKALADFFTEACEYTSDSGESLRGRAAVEKAFADYFKAHPNGQMSIDIESIRYPSRNLAIEEGVIEVRNGSGSMPNTTRYRALHVREDGKWRTALTHEWGGGEDKLNDLGWLIGTWSAKNKDREAQLTFEWNAKKNGIVSRFTVKENGKVVSSGTQRLCPDPRSGGVRAFTFDDSGGHSQAVWYRDGNRWVAEATGVTPDGATTNSVNLLTRLGENEILWRSVERTVEGASIPDSTPIKLTRAK